MFGKTSVKFVRAALDKYLPTIPVERLRFGAPLDAEGIRVHVAPDHIVDYAQVGGWWRSSTDGRGLAPTLARADSGLQTITAVVAADVVSHFRPFLFPTSADGFVDFPYDESDEFVIQQRTAASYEFLIQLANNAIQNSDNAHEVARALVLPLRDAIDRHNLESTKLAHPDVPADDDLHVSSQPLPLATPRERLEFEFGVRDLYTALSSAMPLIEFGIVDFPEGRGGIGLSVQVGEDELVFFRNATGGWGDRENQDLTSVDDDDLEDLTLARLTVHIAWSYVNQYVSGRRSKGDMFSPVDAGSKDAMALLRQRSVEPADTSTKALATGYLSILEVWSPDSLRREFGFPGPSRSIYKTTQSVVDGIRTHLGVNRVLPRLEDDGSYTIFVLHEPESALAYHLDKDSRWSESGQTERLQTWSGVEIESPTIQQVVAYVAADIAFVAHLEGWGETKDEGSDDPEAKILRERLDACLGFLAAIVGGRIEGYESARQLAADYLDHAPPWTMGSSTDEAEPKIGDLDFPDFGPGGWESPKSS